MVSFFPPIRRYENERGHHIFYSRYIYKRKIMEVIVQGNVDYTSLSTFIYVWSMINNSEYFFFCQKRPKINDVTRTKEEKRRLMHIFAFLSRHLFEIKSNSLKIDMIKNLIQSLDLFILNVKNFFSNLVLNQHKISI